MDNFDLVKERLPISSLASHYNAQMNKRFLEPSPCCDHHGCLSVADDGRKWNCFSCGKGGSVIDLVMAAENCSEVDALRKCADIAGIELRTEGADKKKNESLQERMYRTTAEFYHAAMVQGSPGWEYFCGKRGHKEATVKKLMAGYANNKLLPLLEEQGFSPEDIVKHGLARDKDKDGNAIKPKDYFWEGLVVFPVIDHAGRIISFTSKDPSRKFDGMILPGPKKWVLNYRALGKYDELFIVEGENDLASLIDAGFDNAIATSGGPGEEQAKLIRNFCAGKTVYLWFDKDPDKDPRKNEGGARHTRFMYERLRDALDVRIIVHPGKAKDPDDYIRGGFAA